MQNKPTRTEFLGDILDAAISGTDYWANIVRHGDDAPRMIEDADEPETYSKPFDANLIEAGISRVKNPDFQVNRDILANILVADHENDAGEIDIIVADVIVQAAMFGEIVYG